MAETHTEVENVECLSVFEALFLSREKHTETYENIEPVSDPCSDFSSLVVCWLGNDIDTSLPELIGREIRLLEWDEHALDGF